VPVSHFPPADVAAKIAVSLGIGLLVGIEREWAQKELGARSFALTALLGTMSVLISPGTLTVAFVGVLLIIIFAHVRSWLAGRTLELTTSVCLLVTFVLGALAGLGHLFTPVAAAILMTMLLAWKFELSRFVGGLQPEEIRSAVLLGLLGLVVYPILPARFIDRWQLFNPREFWITVIALAGIGFVNYVLLKLYGAKGIYISGFLGGFVNSSAAALEVARALQAGGASMRVSTSALLLTIVAMFTRNLVILGLFSPSAMVMAAVPLLAMTILAVAFISFSKANDEEIPMEIHLESPVSLVRVLKFAGVLLAIQVVSTLSARYFGRLGFLGISVLGGLASSASTSAVAASLVVHGQMQASVAGAGVVLASVTSALVNLPILNRVTQNAAVSRRVAYLTVLLSLVGVICLAVQWRKW
jgi:uncharacterized membrane protein (DUF4010 family)